ncbi:hypothetical protein C922_05446, partial [Plasmodium inui San Antonio 1]
KTKRKVHHNVTEEEILIKRHDIQYNISTRMNPEWFLHNDVTSRKIFTIIAARNIFRRTRQENVGQLAGEESIFIKKIEHETAS